MKKRLEDQLIELAFDSRPDSIPAEIAANPAAHQRLSEYRAMKSALGQLRDVPDHQLSTERLREALLHQGLKRRFQFPWQATAYGTVACALFVCAFFASKVLRTPHQTPRISDPANTLATASKPESTESIKMWLAPSEGDAGKTKNVPAVALHHHRAHQKMVVGNNGARLVLNEKPREPFANSASSPNIESMMQHKLAPVTDARDGDNQLRSKPASPMGKIQDAIVVIHQGTDSNTGLDTAQEDHSKNVLVSG